MKTPKNHGKAWTPETVKQLKQLQRQNTPTRVIGLKMGRKPDAIYSEAAKLGLTLKPVNQAPYGTKKK